MNCPLCHKELEVIYTIHFNYTIESRFQCKTLGELKPNKLVNELMPSHFEIHESGLIAIFMKEWIILESTHSWHNNAKYPYRPSNNKFAILKYSDKYKDYDYFIEIPKFQIKSEEYLLNKLKTLAVFW